MKQLMTARQVIDCYLSPRNHGTEYVMEHFPERYSHMFVRVEHNKKDKELLFTMKFVKADADENGMDAVETLRSCEEDMDDVLKLYPTYLHSMTGMDGYGRLLMLFRHSRMDRGTVKEYIRNMGVE